MAKQRTNDEYLLPFDESAPFDYRPEWTYDVIYRRKKAPVWLGMLEAVVDEINDELVPQTPIPAINVVPVRRLPKHLARYVNGTSASPVVVIDMAKVLNEANRYHVDDMVATESTIAHEIGHAIQDSFGDEAFDEDEAERFAREWTMQRKVWKFWSRYE